MGDGLPHDQMLPQVEPVLAHQLLLRWKHLYLEASLDAQTSTPSHIPHLLTKQNDS